MQKITLHKFFIPGMTLLFLISVMTCSEPETDIERGAVMRFQVSEQSYARFDIENRFDKIVFTKEYDPISPGAYSITWDGRDQNGELQPEGLYFGILQITIDGKPITYTGEMWLWDIHIDL